MRIEEKDELHLVMAEIRQAMGARATALSLHPDDDRAPIMLYNDSENPIEQALMEQSIGIDIPWPDTDRGVPHGWVSAGDESRTRDILLIPVERVPGHSRLVVIAFFDRLEPAERTEAEEVYLRRRPFAVGYFRLWQMERTRKRRIGALQSALNLMEIGVLLLNRDGTVVFSNEAADRILAQEDGLRRRHDTLRAVSMRDGLRLQVAIDHVTHGEDEASRDRRTPIMAISRKNGPPLVLSILPVSETPNEPSDVAAIVYLLDPALDTSQLLQPVCKFYHLTPVETKLVCLLANGATMAQAAVAMRVKEQTARGSLKQVFVKTNTNRQADLVRIMLSNVVRTARIFPLEVL